MSILNWFDKLDDIIYEPIKLVTDWAREPLRKWESERNLEHEKQKIKAESDARIAEQEALWRTEQDRKKLGVELNIKKETEVKRILNEIEEIRKDNEFKRMQAVSEAIMKYQEHLSRLNLNAINAIGNMQLELRDKAQTLVFEKTQKYKKLQDDAHKQAFEEILRIENEFSNNEAAKAILMRSVDMRLANIITTAQKFLEELSLDIAVLNKSINLLTEKSQEFIKDHLGKFHTVAEVQYIEHQTNSSDYQ